MFKDVNVCETVLFKWSFWSQESIFVWNL